MRMRGRYIGGNIFLLIGLFLTYLFSQFCFDTCPSLANIIVAFFIFCGVGYLIGYLLGWLFERKR